VARRFANVKNTNTQTSETTFTPDTAAVSTPTMAGGTQAVAPEVGYAGSFTPQMSAPISFSVQGGGAVGAGKTVRGSRLGRGGPELTRPVSGSVTMGNVSISSTMSPTFSNIGNVDASVKGVTGAAQTQTAPVSTTVGAPQTPKFGGIGGQTFVEPGPTQEKPTPSKPTKSGFDLGTYDIKSQGGTGFGMKDIEYLRSQGVTDKQMQDYTQGLGPNVNFGKVAKETLGLGITAPTPAGVRSTPAQRANTAQLESQMGGSTTSISNVPTGTGPYAPGKGATPKTTAASNQLAGQMSTGGGLQTSGKQQTSSKQTTPAKATNAKAKAQVIKAKETVKETKSVPKEDRTKADNKALEASKAKLQLERLQADKERSERTKAEQRAVEEAKAKAKAAAEAAAKAKAKAQAAKKEPAKTTAKKK